MSYKRQEVYDPLIPNIWVMLQNLDKKGLLVRKYRLAVNSPQISTEIHERTDQPSSISSPSL